MGRAAARIGDKHRCDLPGHEGGRITQGFAAVLVGTVHHRAATVGCACTCQRGEDNIIAGGSPTVLIRGKAAARQTDITAHGGLITSGYDNVMIGVDPFLERIIAEVNPMGSVVNCVLICDAAWARLTGTDPYATAPNAWGDGLNAMNRRYGVQSISNVTLDDVFTAVENGGDGTTALLHVDYAGPGPGHVVLVTNRGGAVGILEAQRYSGWPAEVINNPVRAGQRYNLHGGSQFSYGIIPGSGH